MAESVWFSAPKNTEDVMHEGCLKVVEPMGERKAWAESECKDLDRLVEDWFRDK